MVPPMPPPPRALLFDFGGTLVEELGYDLRAGVELLLANLTWRPPSLRINDVLARAERIQREVSARRDEFQIETPWPAVTRLVYDFFGVHFARPLEDLDLMFWDAIAKIRPMPGAREAVVAIEQLGLPMGVVSNSSFRAAVIRHELAKHALDGPLSTIVASADYVIRKPNALLFELAAALLEVPPRDIWFVGDRYETDILGARAAGMVAVKFGAPNDSTHAAADHAVASWDELATLVAAARNPRQA